MIAIESHFAKEGSDAKRGRGSSKLMQLGTGLRPRVSNSGPWLVFAESHCAPPPHPSAPALAASSQSWAPHSVTEALAKSDVALRELAGLWPCITVMD